MKEWFSTDSNDDTWHEEDDISEAHSATDEAWHWLKPGSSSSGKEMKLEPAKSHCVSVG